MKKLCFRTAAVWLAAVLFLSVPVSAAPSVSAKSAILLDACTGRVLWEQNAGARSLIASTTKIMTGLLVAEECNLDDRVEIPRQAVGTEGSSLYLKEGEVLSVRALLYGLMLQSGNDAAVALALYCGGSMEGFVDRMNEKAEDLGMKDTHYANPHGLDDTENYSTARDLARLAAYAMDNPVFHQVVSTKTAVLENRNLTNHNKLLWRYEGAVGVKTGYTKSAGRILVSCAERDGRRLVAVTISDPNDWADHQALLDYGFEHYTLRPLLSAGEILAEVPVISGGEELAQAVTGAAISYPLAEGERVTYEFDLPVFVFAPVLAGDQAGVLHLKIDGKETVSVPLYWRYSVLESGS